MPELSEEKVAALTEALHRARVEDGSPAPLLPDKADRRHVAHILAPLVAGWLAEAGCEFQRTGDGSHGPLIRQAKAEGLREASRRYLSVAAIAARGAFHDDPDVLSQRLTDIARRLKSLVDQDREAATESEAS